MALTTLADLNAEIGDWLNRDDITAKYPIFVRMVESRLHRILNGKEARVQSDISLTGPTFTLPTGIKELVSIWINSTVFAGTLDVVSPERLNFYRSQYQGVGIPVYFANVGDTLTFVPAPDATYTATIIYDAELVPLVNAGDTNWVMTFYPDIYLFGTLMAAEAYLKNDERIALWEGQFETALAELEKARDRAEYGANTPLVRRKSALGE
jgi:hypothetical protein